MVMGEAAKDGKKNEAHDILIEKNGDASGNAIHSLANKDVVFIVYYILGSLSLGHGRNYWVDEYICTNHPPLCLLGI